LIMATTPTLINALSVLALKVKENVFDLSSNLRHISIRDQVIRAQLLVRDLCDSSQLSAEDSVLIVGAGAAGLAAAESLLEHDCHVLLAEKASEPLWLWKDVKTRFVGPHMYEWPSSFFGDQTFPATAPSVLAHWGAKAGSLASTLTFGKTHPVSVDALRSDWLDALQKWKLRWPSHLTMVVTVNGSQLLTEIQAWRQDVQATNGAPTRPINVSGQDWFSPSQINPSAAVKLVFLAAGFGTEDTALRAAPGGPALITGPPFWSDDKLLSPRAGLSGRHPVRVAVFGGGDGALQDTLRAVTRFDTPLDLLSTLRAAPALAAALDARLGSLASIERQEETAAVWDAARPRLASTLAPDALQAACREQAASIACDLALNRVVMQTQRADIDQVHLVVRESYFGKAYLLNRFLLLLFEECGKRLPSKLTIHWSATAVGSTRTAWSANAYNITLSSGVTLDDINVWAVRLGLDQATIPGQYLGLTKRDTANRRELAEIKLPFALLK
jgi:hypothetical protein